MMKRATEDNMTDEQLRVLIRSNPAVWLEACGYIRDASGRKLRPPAFQLTRIKVDLQP
jgi:hypothetical protein